MSNNKPSSSSSADPHNHQSFPNPLSSSSSSKPLLTAPPQTQSPSPSPSPSLPVFIPQPLPKNLNPSNMNKIQDHSLPPQALLYPLSSSGRGFIPKTIIRPPQSTDQLVTVANPGGFLPRSVTSFPNQVRQFGFPPSDLLSMRPPAVQPSHLGSRQLVGSVSAGPVKSNSPIVNHPKVASLPTSAPDFTVYKDLRDTSRDDTIVTINDRKVRLSDGASIYALCRSWVRNGLPQETQPQFGEGVNLFPRPLPTSVTDTCPKINGGDDDEESEDVGSVEHLSPRELLQKHVKRAKRVRARLRVERGLRIQRYKPRLALLLPSSLEQFQSDGFEQIRSDATPGS